jgi:ceramide glucosyltransferase
VVRREALEKIGGWPSLDSYLAEDFVLGNRIFEAGYRVILSSCRVEHHIGDSGTAENLAHRLRWVRSTRRSRPKGYAGEIFTHTLPLALILYALNFHLWPWLAAAAVLRAASAWAIARTVLHDPLTRRLFWAIPVQDVLAFVTWIAGFFGSRVSWRGRTYYLRRDGRVELIS